MPKSQETQVQFLGWKDPLEYEKATHSSVLAGKIPRTDGDRAWWATVHAVTTSCTQLSMHVVIVIVVAYIESVICSFNKHFI